MAVKKQEEIRIPMNSGLAARLQKVSEATGLSDCELLEKWLTQEESNLYALQRFVESQLRLKHDSTDTLSNVSCPSQDQEESEEPIGSDPGQDYRQTLLQRIQDMREEGMTYSKIAAQFNEEGVATVSGTGKWYPSTISQLLSALQ
jgi:hypothetical protein